MAGPHLPLALLGIFGVPCRDLSIDQAASGGRRLIQKVEGLVTENREKIGATMTNLQQITDKVNKGEGTLGKIVNDPKLHDELVATVDEIKSSAAQAKSFVTNAQAIIDQVKSGKGTIGTLVFDDKAGDDLKASIATLRAVSDKISRGEGTLGKMSTNDDLYTNMNKTLESVNATSLEMKNLMADLKANPKKYLKVSVF